VLSLAVHFHAPGWVRHAPRDLLVQMDTELAVQAILEKARMDPHFC
jgi:hypothetical protein